MRKFISLHFIWDHGEAASQHNFQDPENASFLFCFARALHQHRKSIDAFIPCSFSVARAQEEANLPPSEADSEQLHALLPKVLGEGSKTTLTAEILQLYMRPNQGQNYVGCIY